MKTLKFDHLPDQVKHNGETYYRNPLIETGWERNNTPLKIIQDTLKKEGRKLVLVEVTNPNLKGKKDLHGKDYPSSKFIFTTNPVK